MKRGLHIIIVFLLFPFFTSYAEFDQSKFIPENEKILSDLHNLINAGDINRNKNVYDAVSLCFKMFKERKLGININDSIDKDIYHGMQFQYDIDAKSMPKILISPYMITLYRTRPSIVLSAFVHEMQHAKSYFDDTKHFISMYKSDLEKYYYELDAYNIEANFINTYLSPRNYSLTIFEKFLSKSYDEDNLASFSFGLLGYDMRFAFYLSSIEKKDVSYEDKIDLIRQCLNDLLTKEFKNEGGDWDRYQQTVVIYSALKFLPQIVRNVETRHNKIQDQSNYHMNNQNQELYKMLLDLDKKFNEISKYYHTFLRDTQDRYKKI